MKALVALCVAVFVGCAGMGQVVPLEDRPVMNVYDVKLTKDEIFIKASEWVAKSFVSGKDVTQMSDKESGKIIVKGRSSFMNAVVQIPFSFTMTVDAKENKFRVVFDDYVGYYGQLQNQPQALTYGYEIQQCKAKCQTFSGQLYDFVKAAKNDDF